MQQWTGDSRGRWEGATLVVETRNLKFNDKSRFGVGYLNGLSDENLRVVERFTRTDADTITYQATIEDPTVFTRPWTVELSMDRTRRRALRGGLPRRQLRDGQHPLGPSRRRARRRAARGAEGTRTSTRRISAGKLPTDRDGRRDQGG